MAYIRFYNPVHPAYRDENSNEAYEQLIRHINENSNCGCNQGSIPASNISETDKEFRIEMALPGVDKKNINIRHDKGFLSITVDKPTENESDESYTRHEFDYSGASRTFKTADKIDSDNITAKYENGVLSISLPKKEAFVNKPAQAIVVE
jgi:HSP20 family protein